MSSGLLCFLWDDSGDVSLCCKPAAFLREFPSGFECDVHLRLPKRPTVQQQPSIALFLCKHVKVCASAVKQSTGLKLPHPIALVKSSLQKAIRRGQAPAAVAAAAYLLAHDPKELFRRLPMVLAEDVGMFADLPKLCWLMIACHAGYALQEDDIRLILLVVAVAAAHPVFTAPAAVTEAEIDEALSDFKALSSATTPGEGMDDAQLRALKQSLILRACYGGMTGDIEMLLALAAKPHGVWKEQIVPEVGKTHSAAAQGLADSYMQTLGTKGMGSWGLELPPNLRLEAAVDFHCSNIVPQLRRTLASASEEELKASIWTYRSSLNFRKNDKIPELPPWYNAKVEAEIIRLSRAAWSPQSSPPATSGKSDDSEGPAPKRQRQLSLLRFAASAPAK